ncbi:glycosyltransferase [Candidatus Peregrinibacteria bacterium]|nr:glycosyltransferase [Candidatus Peregrinibacteria bacterium]
MHIAILADPIDNQKAGVHYYTKNLAEALLKIDKKNKYTFIHPKKNEFFKDKEHFIIKSNRHIPGHESYRKFIKIPRLLKKIKPDIVIETCHIGPFNLPKSIKRATVAYDLTPVLFPQFHTKQSSIGHKILFGKVLKNVDLILSISENTKKDIIKKYNPKGLIEVIYAGIDKTDYPKLKRPLKAPYILYLGTIEPRKNLKILIDAFKELKKEKNIPHKLVIAGATGWKSNKFLKKTAKNKDIILTGYLDNRKKAEYYKNADMFVYPSIYEGFGLPPLEAMSRGVPVICSTGGSLNEIFRNHALMFDPHDKKTLKYHISNLIENREIRKKLSSHGKNYASSFIWEKTAQKTLKILEKVINT